MANTTIADLISLDRALTHQQRERLRAGTTPKGYATLLRTGTDDETCGSCEHLFRRRMAKMYLKCGLMQTQWTHGSPSDIRVGSLPCSRWQPIAQGEGGC